MGSTTTNWFFINGVDNVSDRLISNDGNTTFITEHLSFLKIKRITGSGQPCFHVWDTVGDYYEFGCTADSLQYTQKNGSRKNYRWDLNKFVPAGNGLSADNREMTITYVQDKINSGDIVRDAAPKEIIYGNGTARAGTVRFFYKGPTAISSGGVNWVSAYGNNSNCSNPPKTTTLRCDNPLDRDNGLVKPQVMSVFSLADIFTYVGTVSTTNLAHHYDFDYSFTPFVACKESTTLTPAFCAGDYLLTAIEPEVYQNGVARVLPSTVFSYSADLSNTYVDATHSVGGDPYEVSTGWRYLTKYMDLGTGVGATITYQKAYGNTNGTPQAPNGDNRYNALFCSTYTTCTGDFTRPDGKQWSTQVVTSITSSGKDSSASALLPAKTTYQYWLTHTSDECEPDSSGLDDCVRYTWIPPNFDAAWKDYYHAEFRGFAKVLITSAAGNLTVQEYATTKGWETSQTSSANYTAGSLTAELAYQGGAIDATKLLSKTENFYAGYEFDGVDTANTCIASFTSTVYKPCAVMLLKTKTTLYEQTGATNPNAPWAASTFTYDNYNATTGLGDFHQAPATNEYGNTLQEVIQSSNSPTVTRKWSYYTTDTTVSGTVYYNVRSVAHSEVIDASGHKWTCQDTLFDENAPAGVPKPAGGWPTTIKKYSDCANPAGTTLKGYIGYDALGNHVASVDSRAAANPGLYTPSTVGCTLSTDPAIFPVSSWSLEKYTECSAYNTTGAVLTDTWNVMRHHGSISYDSHQGMLPVSSTDANNETTTTSYSYDGSGNLTLSAIAPGETGYTSRSTGRPACTISSTLPCLATEKLVSLYPNAITRTFYDSMGRAVETLMPGPGANQTTVVFAVYNDAAGSVFQSVPFVVPARSTWLDPNGATDTSGAVPTGTITTFDALGRALTVTDPLGNQTRLLYSIGGVSGDSQTYAKLTTIDANQHVTMGYSDAFGRARYTFSHSGVYGGALNANTRVSTQYNGIGLPIAITVTDLAPQGGQGVTEVTTTSQYDDLDRVISSTDPDRGTITSAYDANGQLIKSVSGTRILGTSYDLLGRPGCLQEGEVTTNTPGACGGGNPLVQYTYDANPGGGGSFTIGRLTQVISTTYLADANNTTGIVTETLQYDRRGRVTTHGMQIEMTGGNLSIPQLPDYQVTMAYNSVDQLTTTQTSVGGQPGFTFTQAYDATIGSQIGISNTTVGTPNLVAFSYNNTHALLSDLIFKDTTGASLATTHLLYDGNLRPASSTTTWQNGSAIYTDGVSYDAVSNVTSKVTTHAAIPGVSGSGGNETQNYCYDEQNRLKWASNNLAAVPQVGEHCGTAPVQDTLGGAYTTRFAYTYLGHLWQGPLNGQGAQQQYLYCNPNKPHQVSHLSATTEDPTCQNPGTTQYNASYDAWGNLTTRTYQNQINTLTYDSTDQLTHWRTFSGTKEEWYLYDAAGERVLRYSIDEGAKTLVVYAFGFSEHHYQIDTGGNLIETKRSCYYYGGGRLLGMTSGTTTSQTTTFYLTDSLGSVVSSFSNAAGTAQVLGTQLYGPYGNERYKQGEMGTDLGFTGQYKDSLSGLNYYGARYYDPVVGRFLSLDAFWGGDPYAYVGGNPLTFTDPSGNLAMMPHPGGGGVSTPSPPPVCFNCGNQNNGPPVGVAQPKPTGSGGGGGGGSTTSGGKKGNTVKESDRRGPAKKFPDRKFEPARRVSTTTWVTSDVLDLIKNYGKKNVDASSAIVTVIQESLQGLDEYLTQGACQQSGGMSEASCMPTKAQTQLQAIIGITIYTTNGPVMIWGETDIPGPTIVVCTDPSCSEGGDSAGDRKASQNSFEEVLAGAKSCNKSFTPSTKVTTDEGEKPIGTLQEGDLVLAYDPQTQQARLQPIVHVWINTDYDLLDLTLTTVEKSEDGTEKQVSEVIHTNEEHPFLTTERGFLSAGELVLGMHLVRADGSVGIVSGWQVVCWQQEDV